MKRLSKLWMASVLALTLLAGCSNRKLLVVSTSYPIQYIVTRLAGNLVDQGSLTDSSSGVEQLAQIATAYPNQSTASQTPYYKELLKKADVVFNINESVPYFDLYGDEIRKDAKEYVDLSSNVALVEFKRFTRIQTDQNSTVFYSSAYYDSSAFNMVDTYTYDPSVWLDPTQMIAMARAINTWLIKKMPEEKKTLATNFNALLQDLTTLDYEFTKFKLTSSKVSFVSMTPSYGGWQKTYDASVYPLVLSKYGVLPNETQLEAIKQRILADGVTTIVHEANMPADYEALYRRIRDELGLREVEFDNLFMLSAEKQSQTFDYISVMTANLAALESIANQ